MGQTKRMLENQDAQRAEAVDIAVAGGALRRCDYHSEIAVNQYVDPTDTYRIANARFTANELTADYASRRELTDTIQAAIDDSHISCPICERALAD
jgi:hypothetical protein